MQRYTIFFIAVNAPHVSGGFQPITATSTTPKGAASKPDVYQMLCVQFELLMMGGKPPETCGALTAIKNIV
jgi:hypothetical protein